MTAFGRGRRAVATACRKRGASGPGARVRRGCEHGAPRGDPCARDGRAVRTGESRWVRWELLCGSSELGSPRGTRWLAGIMGVGRCGFVDVLILGSKKTRFTFLSLAHTHTYVYWSHSCQQDRGEPSHCCGCALPRTRRQVALDIDEICRYLRALRPTRETQNPLLLAKEKNEVREGLPRRLNKYK